MIQKKSATSTATAEKKKVVKKPSKPQTKVEEEETVVEEVEELDEDITIDDVEEDEIENEVEEELDDEVEEIEEEKPAPKKEDSSKTSFKESLDLYNKSGVHKFMTDVVMGKNKVTLKKGDNITVDDSIDVTVQALYSILDSETIDPSDIEAVKKIINFNELQSKAHIDTLIRVMGEILYAHINNQGRFGVRTFDPAKSFNFNVREIPNRITPNPRDPETKYLVSSYRTLNARIEFDKESKKIIPVDPDNGIYKDEKGNEITIEV
jgi:hypothetical protein